MLGEKYEREYVATGVLIRHHVTPLGMDVLFHQLCWTTHG